MLRLTGALSQCTRLLAPLHRLTGAAAQKLVGLALPPRGVDILVHELRSWGRTCWLLTSKAAQRSVVGGFAMVDPDSEQFAGANQGSELNSACNRSR